MRMGMRLRCISTLVFATVAAGAASLLLARTPTRPVTKLYLDGREVDFVAEAGTSAASHFEIGQWRFGRKIREPKPNDKRLNLYVVSPGKQYPVNAAPPYGFNCIVNALSKPGNAAEWDIYWAIALDPTLGNADVKSEKALIVATEAEFPAADDFDPARAPGHEILRRYMKISKPADLERFRRESGKLPRLIIVPAGIVLRARVEEPQAAAAN